MEGAEKPCGCLCDVPDPIGFGLPRSGGIDLETEPDKQEADKQPDRSAQNQVDGQPTHRLFSSKQPHFKYQYYSHRY